MAPPVAPASMSGGTRRISTLALGILTEILRQPPLDLDYARIEIVEQLLLASCSVFG